MNELISDEAVCRTAPATPGLLNTAFKYFLQQKETHKKLDQVQYKELQVQTYLRSVVLSNKEKKLLYLLRSRCYDVKSNFSLHKNNAQCRYVWLFDIRRTKNMHYNNVSH